MFEADVLGRCDVLLDPREHVRFAWLTRAQAAALELGAHFRETLDAPLADRG